MASGLVDALGRAPGTAVCAWRDTTTVQLLLARDRQLHRVSLQPQGVDAQRDDPGGARVWRLKPLEEEAGMAPSAQVVHMELVDRRGHMSALLTVKADGCVQLWQHDDTHDTLRAAHAPIHMAPLAQTASSTPSWRRLGGLCVSELHPLGTDGTRWLLAVSFLTDSIHVVEVWWAAGAAGSSSPRMKVHAVATAAAMEVEALGRPCTARRALALAFVRHTRYRHGGDALHRHVLAILYEHDDGAGMRTVHLATAAFALPSASAEAAAAAAVAAVTGPWAAFNLHPTTAALLSLRDGRVLALSARGYHTFATAASSSEPLSHALSPQPPLPPAVVRAEWTRPLDGYPVRALLLPLPLPPAASVQHHPNRPSVVLVGDDGGGWRVLDVAAGTDAPLRFVDGTTAVAVTGGACVCAAPETMSTLDCCVLAVVAAGRPLRLLTVSRDAAAAEYCARDCSHLETSEADTHADLAAPYGGGDAAVVGFALCSAAGEVLVARRAARGGGGAVARVFVGMQLEEEARTPQGAVAGASTVLPLALPRDGGGGDGAGRSHTHVLLSYDARACTHALALQGSDEDHPHDGTLVCEAELPGLDTTNATLTVCATAEGFVQVTTQAVRVLAQGGVEVARWEPTAQLHDAHTSPLLTAAAAAADRVVVATGRTLTALDVAADSLATSATTTMPEQVATLGLFELSDAVAPVAASAPVMPPPHTVGGCAAVVLAAGMWRSNCVRVTLWGASEVPDLLASDGAAVLSVAATPRSLLLMRAAVTGRLTLMVGTADATVVCCTATEPSTGPLGVQVASLQPTRCIRVGCGPVHQLVAPATDTLPHALAAAAICVGSDESAVLYFSTQGELAGVRLHGGGGITAVAALVLRGASDARRRPAAVWLTVAGELAVGRVSSTMRQQDAACMRLAARPLMLARCPLTLDVEADVTVAVAGGSADAAAVVTRDEHRGRQQLRVLHGRTLHELLVQELPPREVATAMLCAPVPPGEASTDARERHLLMLCSYTVDSRRTLHSVLRVYEVTWRRPCGGGVRVGARDAASAGGGVDVDDSMAGDASSPATGDDEDEFSLLLDGTCALAGGAVCTALAACPAPYCSGRARTGMLLLAGCQDRVQVYHVCLDEARDALAVMRAAALVTIAAAAEPPRLLPPPQEEQEEEQEEERTESEEEESDDRRQGNSAPSTRATAEQAEAAVTADVAEPRAESAAEGSEEEEGGSGMSANAGAGGAERAAERVSVRLVAECGTVASSSVVALACLGQERATAESVSAGVGFAVTEAAGGVTMMLLQSLGDGSLALSVASHAPLDGSVVLSVCGAGDGQGDGEGGLVAATTEDGEVVMIQRDPRSEAMYIELQRRRRQEEFEAFGVPAGPPLAVPADDVDMPGEDEQQQQPPPAAAVPTDDVPPAPGLPAPRLVGRCSTLASLVAVASGGLPIHLPVARLPLHAKIAAKATPAEATTTATAGSDGGAAAYCSAVYGTTAGELGLLQWIPAAPEEHRLVALNAVGQAPRGSQGPAPRQAVGG